ncbi:hypothetical protein PHMEG_0008463 [Phytophthora megakarya]|uniref:Uncharacterized protein n=1 Tax=Phytophthora megakarya TaxID=4795 RepID=A0A225WIQ6_9STRA|nr:hypothetical protein PHMEG_0008463 [Phytophthora megakarya]
MDSTSIVTSKTLYTCLGPAQEVKTHVRGKFQDWAMSLTGLKYQIEHVNGSTDLWADVLSRWGLRSGEKCRVTKCKAITRSSNREATAADKQIQQLHLRAGDFIFPTLSEIQAAQQKHARVAPASANVDKNNPY